MKTIAITNLKGGVGKTTTAINLAYLLATEHDKRVLLVDNDRQGNLSQFFDVYDIGRENNSMSEIMLKLVHTKEAVWHMDDLPLDIIPANFTLEGAEARVAEADDPEQQEILQQALAEVDRFYDYAIIDNGPSAGMCSINAWMASDYLVSPLKLDQFAINSMDNFLTISQNVKEQYAGRFTFLGTLITNYRNNDVNLKVLPWLKQQDKYKVFQTKIRWSEKVDESSFKQEAVRSYSPHSAASHDYRVWVKELLGMMEGGHYEL